MSRLPRLDGRRLIRILRKIGFSVVRVRGSHHFPRHPDGRATVVPVHAGEIIGPGLLRRILSDCDLTREQIERWL
jgi:predicted RNA binding protein YcfA (HicA-like mRNA interferase family)